jgi:hypothetical protein
MQSQFFFKAKPAALILLTLLFFLNGFIKAQQGRRLSGVVVNNQNETVSGVSLIISSPAGDLKALLF